MRSWKGSRIWSAVPTAIFLIAFCFAVYRQKEFYFRTDPIQACRETYWPNPFPEALELSDYIKKNSSADATIAVLGSEPEIFFYTHRRSATGYIYTYPLLEPQKYALTMQKEMEAEIEKSRPEVLVLVNNPKSWVAWSDLAPTDDILAWANQYMRDQYDVVGLAVLGEVTKYYWGAEARERRLPSQANIYVLKRKAS
jgi:hypothetical protein